LSTLVSIYGSTEIFVSEYRSILAEKLFSNVNYITDNEVTNLELLKIRFGEEYLHNCEVMLRDVEDSKRVNNSIHSYLNSQYAAESDEEPRVLCDSLIISDFYWPPNEATHLVHHSKAKEWISNYENTYSVINYLNLS